MYAQSSGEKETYVAKAGETFISREEFIHRFEMLPGLVRHRTSHLGEDKLEFLYTLIAEKLLAQEAVTRKLDRDSIFITSYNEIRKMLARDELYRDEIRRKITVTEKEVKKGIEETRRRLLISYLYSDNLRDAKKLLHTIQQTTNFDSIQHHSVMKILSDTATVIWGEAEQPIETASYLLHLGEVSPIVEAGSGYYILKLISDSVNSFYSSMPLNVLRERISDKLRLRKERTRTTAFIREFLRDKTGYSRPAPFNLLSKSLLNAYKEHSQDSIILFDTEIRNSIIHKCGQSLTDSFVVAGTTVWTLNIIIDKLFAKGFNIPSGTLNTIPARLNAVIEEWVDQEILAQEALRRKLDQRPSVQRQLQTWHDSFLAEIMKSYVRGHVSVSDNEVFNALGANSPRQAIPRVKIRELRTHGADQMSKALEELSQGQSFEHVIERWSEDPDVIRTHGVSDFFLITERPPIGEQAWNMNIGDRYGPIEAGSDLLFFELLAKEDSSILGDTTARAMRETMKKEVLRMKQKRTLDLFLAQTGERRGFDIYQDQLLHIPVSPIPMMTFRYIGFGGRMFSVPFVDKQLDWINIDPPEKTIIP
jgi:parvulin-like peptidyl-prolyl isomerase